MTTADTRTSTTVVLVGTALLVLPAIALPLYTSRITMGDRPMPWLFGIVVPVAALAAIAAIWRWPDKGWRWVLLADSLCALVVGILASSTADRAVVMTLASPVGMTALIGVLGAAGWLAHSDARPLAAMVAGLAVATYGLRHVVALVDLGSQAADLTPLFAVAGLAILCAAALLALGTRFPSEHARLPRRLVIAAMAAALIPVAFTAVSWLLPVENTGWFREIGVVAVVAVLIVVALTAWADPRQALAALSLGALVVGVATIATYILFLEIAGFQGEPSGGLDFADWLLILTGLAVGTALALLPIRGYLGAVAALVGAVALYLADAEPPGVALWHQFAVAAVIAAVVAGAAAVCDGPSAVAVGVIGVTLGAALDAVDWIWTDAPTNPVYSVGPVDWVPVVLMAAAAIGLAAHTFLGARAQRLQTYQTSGLPTVP
ncbi:hypothetical protein SAMN05192558_11523 [Actinokineospora alba]|uniref:Uncharacterized protein n=1 Tax=Actinokineospora alba TaxID=504798 RepID=A0A1H0VQL1_9PSEU|nr:hypothetical protein [Actinokineospora alba]TDP70175.1 hypothetical protein C8E96_5777 [Actinokineospora alba]SDI37434.1 hypothetical protein SAMN05421871_104374 [Actinokineospora alba]SDP80551.1 hypothetical protein SAMN05192558_11523 [Actinokineospora alba]